MEQGFLNIQPSQSFSLKLGLHLVPFGKYNVMNRPHQTMLIEPPLPVENVYPQSWRDIGILVDGEISKFFYSAYLGNGLAESEYLNLGQQFKDNNSNKSFGGRVGLDFGEGFEAAFSYYRGRYDDDNERDLTLKGFDVSWISEGVYVISEYLRADMENPADFDKGKAEGYFILFGFDAGRFRPVGSYQKVEYRDIFHGDGFEGPEMGGEGIDMEKSRWTVGLMYFSHQNVYFKLEYQFNEEKDMDIKDNLFLIQVALNF